MLNLTELLKNEQERVAEAITHMDPGTEEYTRAFELLRAMQWELRELQTPIVETVCPPPTFTPAPVITPDEEPAPSVPAIDFNVEEYKSNLRIRLANARTIYNADTKAWLSKVGAAKFSAITDPCKLMKLNELVSEFEKEHP